MGRKQKKIVLLTSLTRKNEAREHVLGTNNRNQIINCIGEIEKPQYQHLTSTSTPNKNNQETSLPSLSPICFSNSTINDKDNDKLKEPLQKGCKDIIESKIKILENITLIPPNKSSTTSGQNMNIYKSESIHSGLNCNSPLISPIANKSHNYEMVQTNENNVEDATILKAKHIFQQYVNGIYRFTHFDGLETILLLEYMQKLLRDTIDTKCCTTTNRRQEDMSLHSGTEGELLDDNEYCLQSELNSDSDNSFTSDKSRRNTRHEVTTNDRLLLKEDDELSRNKPPYKLRSKLDRKVNKSVKSDNNKTKSKSSTRTNNDHTSFTNHDNLEKMTSFTVLPQSSSDSKEQSSDEKHDICDKLRKLSAEINNVCDKELNSSTNEDNLEPSMRHHASPMMNAQEENVIVISPKDNVNVMLRTNDLSNNNISYKLHEKPLIIGESDMKKAKLKNDECNVFKKPVVSTRILRSKTKEKISNVDNNFVKAHLPINMATSSSTILNVVSEESSECGTSEMNSITERNKRRIKKGTSSVDSKILTNNTVKKKVEILLPDHKNTPLVKLSSTNREKQKDIRNKVQPHGVTLTNTNTKHKLDIISNATASSLTSQQNSTLRKSSRIRKAANTKMITYIEHVDSKSYKHIMDSRKKQDEEKLTVVLDINEQRFNNVTSTIREELTSVPSLPVATSNKRKPRSKRTVNSKTKVSTNLLTTNIDGDNLPGTSQILPSVLEEEEEVVLVKSREVHLNKVEEVNANSDVHVDESGDNLLETWDNNLDSKLSMCGIYHKGKNMQYGWLIRKPNCEKLTLVNPYNELCLSVFRGNGKLIINKKMLPLVPDVAYIIQKGQNYSIINTNKRTHLKIHLVFRK